MTLTYSQIQNIVKDYAEKMAENMYDKMPRSHYSHVENVTVDLLEHSDMDAMAEVDIEFGYDTDLAYIEVLSVSIVKVFDEDCDTISIAA